MDRTDVSLILAAFSALAVLIGPIAALVIASFVAGLIVGSRRDSASAPGSEMPTQEPPFDSGRPMRRGVHRR